MRRASRALLAAGLVVAVAGTVVVVQRRAEQERARDRGEAAAVAEAFLTAWEQGRWSDMTEVTAGRDDPGSAYRRTSERLQVRSVEAVPGPLSADGSTVPFTVALGLAGLGDLAYASELHLVERGDRWRVAFRSSTLHPALAHGEQLQRRSRPGPRLELADRTGRPLRRASQDLAVNVLGVPGETGLERVLDDELTGGAGGAVVVGRSGSDAELRVLQEYGGRGGEPVRTTLDLDVQRAAERAAATAGARTAVVAVDRRTGQVRAVAGAPAAGATTAFTLYAPGSLFKVVTATALLEQGLTPSSPAACPATTTSGGRPFRNSPGTPTGAMTLARATAVSCNSAFLELAEALPAGALGRAAALYGFGEGPLLPIAGPGGEVPEPESPEEAAEDVLGQGRVQATPLLLASMMAAVADGTWRRPSLVPGERAQERPLPDGVAPALRTLLRGVVTGGTGSAAQPATGGPVSGKTGTAQYGKGDPLPTHAWFAGWQGDLAFCVFVESGSSGGAVAAPVARRFLADLRS